MPEIGRNLTMATHVRMVELDLATREYARPRRMTTGPYMARHPAVVAAMAGLDGLGAVMPRRSRVHEKAEGLSVVVANGGHLGDIVVMLPLLAALRERREVAQLGVLVGPWAAPIFEAARCVDRIHYASHWTLDRSRERAVSKLARHARSRWEAVRTVRTTSYDFAIDAYAWFGNASTVLWAAGIPQRVGFSSGGGRTLYTRSIPFDPCASVLGNQVRLLEAAGFPVEAPRACLPGFVADREAEAQVRAFGRYVVIHMGSGTHARAWPENSWLTLCARLQSSRMHLVFSGAEEERPYVDSVRRKIGGLDFLGRSFRAFATLIRGASGVVSIDSVAGHLAACFGVPAVVLRNGVQPAARWAPNHPLATSLTSSVGCSPCHRSKGCTEMACLRTLSPDKVYTTLIEIMARLPS